MNICMCIEMKGNVNGRKEGKRMIKAIYQCISYNVMYMYINEYACTFVYIYIYIEMKRANRMQSRN